MLKTIFFLENQEGGHKSFNEGSRQHLTEGWGAHTKGKMGRGDKGIQPLREMCALSSDSESDE